MLSHLLLKRETLNAAKKNISVLLDQISTVCCIAPLPLFKENVERGKEEKKQWSKKKSRCYEKKQMDDVTE